MSGGRRLIPLYTDLTDRHVLVVGGGEAARRVLRDLEPYTEHLYYLTPENGEDAALPAPDGSVSYVKVLRKPYERPDLYGMDYVISLSEDEAVNEDIYITCRTLGIRVSIPSNPKRCDFRLRPLEETGCRK